MPSTGRRMPEVTQHGLWIIPQVPAITGLSNLDNDFKLRVDAGIIKIWGIEG